MEEKETKLKRCPKCGKMYTGYPATSRDDGRPICEDCGSREAMRDIGICEEEAERIIAIMHRKRKGVNE